MNRLNQFGFIVMVLFLLTQSLYAGKVRGKILDADSGEAVFGASVIVRSTNTFAKTDFDGKYELDLPAGSHVVEYQMFGYAPQKKSVNVKDDGVETVNITFGAKKLDVVQVEGRALNNTEASLLQLQKKSTTVSDGISQESIKKSPDSSAGEVVKRVSGITLLGGKYVFVRGLGERYSTTVLNEALIPSVEPDKRVVPLDIFPSGMLKNVRIIKTFVPEDTGEFSGGIVKIETQEYPDQFQAGVNFGIGRNYNTTGNRFLTFDAGDALGRVRESDKMPGLIKGLPSVLPFEPGSRFGGLPPQLVQSSTFLFDNAWTPEEKKASYDRNMSFSIGNTFKSDQYGKFGVLVGSSYNKQYRFRREKMKRYIPGNLVGQLFNDTTYLNRIQEQDSDVFNEETLIGNNFNIAYQPTDGHQFYSKTLYTISSDKMVRDSLGVNYIDNFQFNAQTQDFISRGLLNTTLGGTHALNFTERPHKLEWQVNYANAKRDEPNLRQQVWRRSDPPNDGFKEQFTRLGNNPDGTRFYSEAEENMKSGSLKYEIPFEQWDGFKSTLKLGTLVLEREKGFEFREFGQKSNVGGDPKLNNYPIPGEIVFIPTAFTSGQKTFSERQVEPNAYNARQSLRAYFTQVDMPIIPKWRFIGGVRYEDSYQKVSTFVMKDGMNPLRKPNNGCKVPNDDIRVMLIRANVCDPTNWGIGELATQDYLPSLNLVHELTDKVNLRFGYSETLTRPDLRELSPFGFTPYFGADRIFGNSDLRRTYIHNYDFRWEYYIKGGDYVGAGVFYKQLSSPIEMIGQPVAGSISPRFTYLNANQAKIQGVEIDYRKELFDLFRIETNFFFIKSMVDVMDWKQFIFAKAGMLDRNSRAFTYDPTNIKRPLQGQSEFVFNAKFDVFLNKKKTFIGGIYYNYFGDRIYAVGANGTPDAYERGVGLTDFVLTYKHLDKWDFKFAAKNVTDQRFRIYQKDEVLGTKNLFFAYREGPSFSMSAGYKF
jgi:outer membrane receptor protein involved in Fe transport